MIVHVSLRRTHIELAKRKYQRLRVDMNHHARPRKVNAASGTAVTLHD